MSNKNGSDPFDMEASSETFNIGGRGFTLRPLKVKNFRRIMNIVSESINEFIKIGESGGDGNVISRIGEYVLDKNSEIFNILFDGQGMDATYVDENMTLPMARSIIEKAITMNKLDDLFPIFKKITQQGASSSKPEPQKTTGT